MNVKPEVACEVVESLGRMWKSGECCDFTIVVEDERIQCHRCVLCACSEFFRGLFNSEMKEQAEGCVTIPNITKATMDVIFNFLYTGEDRLTKKNVIDVWHASNQLQMRFMITECENFIMDNMNIHNYLEIYERAKLLDSWVMIMFSHGFMMENFKLFRQTETFLNLPVDVLHSMVDSQNLVTASENLVVESILKWVCFNPQPLSQSKSANNEVEDVDNGKDGRSSNNTEAQSGNETRKSHLAQLLSVCRLYLCDPDFLQTLRCNEVVASCPRSLSLIVNAEMYNTNPDRHNDCWPSEAVFRNCSSNRAGIIYTQMHANYPKILMCFFSVEKEKIIQTFIFNRVGNTHVSITVFNNKLYCYNNSNLFVVGEDKKWSQVTQNQEVFEKAQLLSHGDHIYASNVKREPQNEYCISLHRLTMNNRTDNWSRCLEIRAPSEEHSLASCGRRILLLTQNQQADNTSVTCYDPEKQAVRKLNAIEGPAKNITSFCFKKEIYVLQENGSLWKAVNCQEETLHLQFVSELLDPSWSVRGATIYSGELFLFVYKMNTYRFEIPHVSLPGLFESIKVIKMEIETTYFLPILAPIAWMSETEASESNSSS